MKPALPRLPSRFMKDRVGWQAFLTPLAASNSSAVGQPDHCWQGRWPSPAAGIRVGAAPLSPAQTVGTATARRT